MAAGPHTTAATGAPTASRTPVGLGMKIGSSMSVAVSTTPSGTYDALVRPTALDVAADGEPVLVAAGARSSSQALVGFTGRVGDPVALVTDDGRRFSGEDLYAAALAGLAEESRSDATSIVVTCPNSWQPYTVDTLRAAAEHHGLADVTFVPEAIASVAAAHATGRELRGSTSDSGIVAVVDLGGSALDITVVETGDQSQIIGRPMRSEEISGDAFDQLLLAHVLASVDAVDSISPFDPATIDALTELRRRCTAAKEALSADTETSLTVELPGLHAQTRLVRSEIESLLHDQMFAAVSLLRDAVAATGHGLRDIDALLLTGGGAAMPLVTEMVSGILRIPVVVDADPATTSAFGAAILAAEIDSATAALDSMPANAAAAAAELRAATSAVAAPATAVTPAPRTPVATRTTTGRNRRLAIIGGVAVAIALITAGGLSVGTALSSDSSPAATPTASTPAATQPSTAPSSSAPSSTRPSAATSSGAAGSDAGSGGAAGSGSGSSGATGRAPGATATNPGGGANGGATNGGGSTGGGTSGGSTGGGTSGGSTGSGSGGSGSGSGSGSSDQGGDSGGTAPEQTFNPIPTVPALPTVPRLGGLFGG